MRSWRVLVGVGRGGKVSALLGVLGALIVAAAAGEGSAAVAAMPRGLEVTLQDDALLLYRPRRQVRRSARRIAAIGADRVRLTASWSALAPDPDSRHRPRFDATNPSRYRREGMRRLDFAVSEAAGAGLSVQIDLAFWAPRWASSGRCRVIANAGDPRLASTAGLPSRWRGATAGAGAIRPGAVASCRR